MDLHLREKVAIVTGGSQGIGLAITTALAEEGASVVAASRNPHAAVGPLSSRLSVVPFAVDLSSANGPQQLVDYTVSQFGRVDILINNLGIATIRPDGFLSVSDDDWYHLFEVNLMSMVRAARAVLPIMVEQGKGSIVNIASGAAVQPAPVLPEYSALKSAMLSLSKALSEEFGPKGIRVNTVSPGGVNTPLWTGDEGLAEAWAQASGTTREAILSQLPQMFQVTLGRLLEAEEVATLAVFLASDRSAMITGANYIIDGGSTKML